MTKPFIFMIQLSLIMAILLSGINPATAKTLTLMAFGDSLTAGPGLPESKAFPMQLEHLLKKKSHDIKVINAGVSGETTGGGLTRLTWTLNQNPDFLILALGANDMLRGIPMDLTEKNLRAILDILKEKNIPVLLAGMRAYRNLHPGEADFAQIYDRIAADYDVIYYPFFLEGVALDPALNQNDGLHPNEKGVTVIVQNILPYVEQLIKEKE